MKRLAGIVIVLLLALSVIAGCGRSGGGKGESGGSGSGAGLDSVKTIGDLKQFELYGYSYADDKLVMVVIRNDEYIRADAVLPKEVEDQLADLSWEDPDHDKKFDEFVAPVEIAKLTNLSEQLLSQEELDKLVGKSGKDLLENGWTVLDYYADDKCFFMENGPFQYRAVFEESITESEEMDMEALVKPLTVKSIVFVSLSSSAVDVE